MSKEIKIIVENRLLMEMRYINAYRSTRSAHIISYDSAATLLLGEANTKDYIQISSHSGPNHQVWSDCLINIPAWANFEFFSEGKITLIHESDRTVIKIPKGPPTWLLKIIRPEDAEIRQAEDYIIVTDDRGKIKEA